MIDPNVPEETLVERCERSLATPPRDPFFGGLLGDDLVEQRPSAERRLRRCSTLRVYGRGDAVVFRSENSTEALRELPFAAAPRQHDGDVGVRHVDAFVEHVRGHDPGVLAGPEPR